MRVDLEKRLSALEEATAPPRAFKVQQDIIRQGEPTPRTGAGVDLHNVNVIVPPRFKHDTVQPRPVETVTIGPQPAEPVAAPARMPLIRRD